MNRVSTDWRDIEEPAWLGTASAFAAKALEAIGKDDWELSLVFCSDPFIQSLNRDYRQKDEPTDVLSFPMGESVDEGGDVVFLAGDIVISVPALMRNASEFSVDADEELKRLMIHGILHLSGMDHDDNSPKQPMLVRQEEILARLSGEKIL